MNIAEFKIGDRVIYRSYPNARPEEGSVTSVNKKFVFVRYGADITSKATSPKDLTHIFS